MAATLRFDFTSDEDPLAMLAALIDLVTPTFRTFGYTPEQKHPASAGDWMHWNRSLHDLVRAYAFKDGERGGVSILGQGDIPEGLGDALFRRVTDSTNWRFANPS